MMSAKVSNAGSLINLLLAPAFPFTQSHLIADVIDGSPPSEFLPERWKNLRIFQPIDPSNISLSGSCKEEGEKHLMDLKQFSALKL